MKLMIYLCLLVITLALSGCIATDSTLAPTETQVPSSTFAPAQTATLTPPATLEPEQAEQVIRKLLQEPVDCEAPCFWGITPGQTALNEAKNIFIRLGLEIKGTTQEDQNFYGIRYDFDSGLSIIVSLTIQDEIVRNLRVDITPETYQAGVPRKWLAYSPEVLINRYGPPSKVNFFVGRAAPTASYTLDMYFESVDLIIEYYSYELGTNLQVCPLVDNFAIVRMWMGKDPLNPPFDMVPLEEATSLTLDEFAELITGSPNKPCFNLKEAAFP